MARIKCCECGEIFPMQDGDIQICPKCNSKMRINNPKVVSAPPANEEQIKEEIQEESSSFSLPKEQPITEDLESATGDDYSSIRNDYVELMKKQIENGNSESEPMIMIPKRIYDELVSGAILRKTQEVSNANTEIYNNADFVPIANDGIKANEQPIKKSKGVFSFIMIFFSFAATILTLFFNAFTSEVEGIASDRTVLEQIMHFFENSKQILGIVAISLYVIIALASLIFFFARKTKAGQILGGLFYLLEGAGVVFIYSIYKIIDSSFDIKYLQFWNYYTVPMMIFAGMLILCGLILFVMGLAKKKTTK